MTENGLRRNTRPSRLEVSRGADLNCGNVDIVMGGGSRRGSARGGILHVDEHRGREILKAKPEDIDVDGLDKTVMYLAICALG